MNFIPNAGNMVVAEDTEFTLDDIGSKRNNNYLIVGASGTSKTRSIVIPNILKATGSYVISDPKGSLFHDYADYLKEKGYDIFLLDFRNPYSSNGYNPLDYVKSHEDALKVASLIYERTESKDDHKYWELSGIYLLAAVIDYVKSYLPKKYHNMSSVADFICTKKIKVKSDSILCKKFIEKKYKENMTPEVYRQLQDALQRDGVDEEDMTEYFKFMQKTYPCSVTRYYSQLFNENAETTIDCIFMEANFALQCYATPGLRELTSRSDFKFSDLGDRKVALFVTCSDTDRSMDSFVNLFYTQCLQELCNYADTQCEGHRLKVPVRFFLDDFATNYKIKDFDKTITMIRSRGISATIIVQDLNQLSTSYGSGGKTIINNCDNIVYLGGNDYLTYDEISKIMNKPLDEIRSLKYRECFVYRRLEDSKKAILLNLDSYKRHILDGYSYKRDIKLQEKPKNKVGFQI